jgi:hypothetical protein
MPLTNYRDLSVASDVGAGFQYEFFCSNCDRKWKSPFKPYRLGQITGLLTRFTFMFTDLKTAGRTTGNLADIGSRGAREKAFAEARTRAEALYTTCPSCRKDMCADCFDEQRQACLPCLGKAKEDSTRQAEQQADKAVGGCPNCSQPHAGGRFCAECGFDMASTHKSCPACSAMLPRQARFCNECGHGF